MPRIKLRSLSPALSLKGEGASVLRRNAVPAGNIGVSG